MVAKHKNNEFIIVTFKGGGTRKIESRKLEWNTDSKVTYFENSRFNQIDL